MKTNKRSLVIAALALALSACAYNPVVDRPGPSYQQDLAECRALAEGEAGAGTGAAVGAVGGAVLGEVVGRTGGLMNQRGHMSGLGAALGAMSGAAAGAQAQREVVQRCLIGRGYRVLR